MKLLSIEDIQDTCFISEPPSKESLRARAKRLGLGRKIGRSYWLREDEIECLFHFESVAK